MRGGGEIAERLPIAETQCVRVLLVHCRYRSPSGEEAVVERERTLLEAAGHDVELVEFTNDRGRASTADLAMAVHNPIAVRRLRRALASFAPDVVHVHNTWFAASPAVMSEARSSGVATVATLHNYRAVCAAATLRRDGADCTDCLSGSVQQAVRHRCVNGSLVQSTVGAAVVAVRRRSEARDRLVDRYIAPTAALRDRVVGGGIPADRVEVIPHFVPDPGEPVPFDQRSRTLVYAGRLSEEKGIDVAVEAWSRLVDRPVDARFLVIGEGPLEDELRARAVPGVEFLGRRPAAEVAATLATARLAVVPSVWSEPFGLFILEAMAAGLGVVASSSGGAPEFLADGAGWLVPPGDAAALADRLASLLAADDETDGLVRVAGEAARHRTLTQYGGPEHLARLEQIYRVVRKTGAPK